MTCDAWSAKLDAYVDSELPAEQMEAVHSHLRGCPSCTSQMAERLQLKRAIGIAGRQFSPSAELRRKVQKQVGKPQRAHWRWLAPAAVAAVLLLAIFFNLRIGSEALPQFREIAEAISVPIGTVMSRLWRARRAVKQTLLNRTQKAKA